MLFLLTALLLVDGHVALSSFFYDVITVADSYEARCLLVRKKRAGGLGGLVRFGDISFQPFWLVLSLCWSLQTYSGILLVVEFIFFFQYILVCF